MKTHLNALAAVLALTATAAHADQYIRLADDTDKCMHKQYGNFDNGNPIHLWDCDAGSDDNKTFVLDTDTGYIHLAGDTSKCLHKEDAGFADGNDIHVWDCSAGDADNKTWYFDAATGYIRAMGDTSACMHTQYSNTDNGNPIHLWQCSEGDDASKTWVMDVTYPEPVAAGVEAVTITTNHAYASIGLSTEAADGVQLAQIATYNGTDPSAARINAAGQVNVEEYHNGTHMAEDIDVLSIMGDLSDLGVPSETGAISMADGATTVTLSGSYSDPVVFAQVVSENGGDAVTVNGAVSNGVLTLQMTESTSFDGAHTTETVHYLVIEAGTYAVHGKALIVGNSQVTSGSNASFGAIYTTFYDLAADSVVIARPQTTSADWLTTRIQKNSTDGLLETVSLRFEDETRGSWSGAMGYLLYGDDMGYYTTVALPDAVAQGAGLAVGSSISVQSYYNDMRVTGISAVALQAHDGSYVVAENGGGGDAMATSDSIDTAERFLRIDFDNGYSALRSVDGYYLQAASTGGAGATFDRTFIGTWERFTFIEQSDSKVALQAYDGTHYLVSESGGGDTLNANRTNASNWEKFTLIDLTTAYLDAIPSVTLRSVDMDNDGEEELVLFSEFNDGTGCFTIDPMGIADTLTAYGYRPTADLLTSLSATQLAALEAQVDAVMDIGAELDIDDVNNMIDEMNTTAEFRSYNDYEFSFALDAHVYDTELGDDWVMSVGNLSIQAEISNTATGFNVVASAATFTRTDGVITNTITVGQAKASRWVSSDSITMGAAADLVAVDFAAGNPNGTYAAIGVSVGGGMWGDLSFGRNNQYGFNVPLSPLPVSVGVYVSGDDIEDAANAVADWTVGAGEDTADFAAFAWSEASGWVEGAAGDIAVVVSDSANDTIASVQKVGENAVVVAQAQGEALLSVVEDVGDAVADTLVDVGDAIEDAANGVANAIDDLGDAIGDAANDAATATNTAVKWFVSLF